MRLTIKAFLASLSLVVALPAAAQFDASGNFEPASFNDPGPIGDRTDQGVYGTLLQKGVQAMQAGQFTKAQDMFDRMVKRKPYDSLAHFLAGSARAAQKDKAGAVEYYRMAAFLKPEFIEAQVQLGLTSIAIGDVDRATEARDGLIEQAKSCAATCKNAAYLDSAISLLDNALAAPRE
jgi:tetratricopeptide (TPR) repeat protein